MKILQINTSANSGSTGRIAEGIGNAIQKEGIESWIAYGRVANQSTSQLIKIGNSFDCYEHAIETRLFDNHGLASRRATISFLQSIDKLKPDLIHLHNIHGYYLNYKLLFSYIKNNNIPVVWTFHDCWPFTGHCPHFSFRGCNKWTNECFACPQKKEYPKSILFDRSHKNYLDKKSVFTALSDLTIVSVSQWLDRLVSQSFFKSYASYCIHNGIDIDIFSPTSKGNEIRSNLNIRQDDLMLLGVTSVWRERKGFHDFIELSKHLLPNQKIVLIGLTKKQIKMLPETIIGLERTESTRQLAEYYSAADMFLNLTYEDNYPTTNLESISCGTPCLTYHTGGSIESITSKTGFVVPQGDLKAVMQCVETIQKNGKASYSTACRDHALAHFRQEDRFQDYIDLYHKILNR